MTHVDGSSGTVGTIWDVVFQKKTLVKLNAGKPSVVTLELFVPTVVQVISFAVLVNAKHSFIGRMIVGGFDKV
jgi:hypothetical protein